MEKLYLDVMVSDASKPVWRKAALFDAIITDRRSLVYSQQTSVNTLGMLSAKTCEKCAASILCNDFCLLRSAPYGIRESTRRTGSHKDIAKPPDAM